MSLFNTSDNIKSLFNTSDNIMSLFNTSDNIMSLFWLVIKWSTFDNQNDISQWLLFVTELEKILLLTGNISKFQYYYGNMIIHMLK
jgi:hypothetical protein